MTTGIIIQARMTSTRFPGKVLKPLLGKPVLHHVIERVKRAEAADVVIVAYPHGTISDPIRDLAIDLGAACSPGSEHDVLRRFYDAACKFRLQHIVRITSDCPFVDPYVIDAVILHLQNKKVDYASNVFPTRTFPKGFDTQAFTYDCLEAAALEATMPHDREHVCPWMERTPGLKRGNVVQNKDLSGINLCVDYPIDIDRLEMMAAKHLEEGDWNNDAAA